MRFTRPHGNAAPVIILTLAAVGAVLVWLMLVIGGVETGTTSPSPEQVAHAREYLYIAPNFEIEPLAYAVKHGTDHIVRFKFIARTDDPALVFDTTQIDPSKFSTDFVFPPGEETHNEDWWDLSTQPVTGGSFWVPTSEPDRFYWLMHIGCVENGDGTLTVYAIRVEHGKYRT